MPAIGSNENMVKHGGHGPPYGTIMSDLNNEEKALAERLQMAFNHVHAPASLADTIRKQSQPVRWRWWSGSSLAAAVLLFVALPLGWYFMNDTPEHQAYAELSKIHHSNLTAEKAFVNTDDPDQLANFFREQLGFTPQLPELGKGLAILGCCVKHFRGQIVGSYVVDTPQGVISIIVVTDTPESLGMKPQPNQQGTHTFWNGDFAYCNMVTVQIGNISYCAVSDLPHKELTALLQRLLPSNNHTKQRPTGAIFATCATTQIGANAPHPLSLALIRGDRKRG